MSETIGETIIPQQLDFAKRPVLTPQLRMTKILPQVGTQTVPVSQTGGQESIFELPVQVMNLSKGYIQFTVTPAASGAGNINWLWLNGVPFFQQIQLMTRSGKFLCDLNQSNVYTNLCLPPQIRKEEFDGFDLAGNASGWFQGFRRSNALTNVVPAVRHNNGASSVPYEEMAYLLSGTANTADPVLQVKVPLSLFKDTILGLDKELWFGEILLLRFVWAPATRIAFYGTSAVNPTTGPAAAFGGSITMSNLTLYMPIETNQVISNMIIDLCRGSEEGMSVLIPYTSSTKTNLSGTSQTVSIRYNRGNGLRLKRIYHGVYNNSESGGFAYDHTNILAAKVTSFYTNMDNERLQQYNLSVNTGDDYAAIHEKLKGSLILSSDVYYYNHVWIDDFAYSKPPSDLPISIDQSNMVTGLSLDNDHKWDAYFTTADSSFNHYTFSVCEKLLKISPLGIDVL